MTPNKRSVLILNHVRELIGGDITAAQFPRVAEAILFYLAATENNIEVAKMAFNDAVLQFEG